MKLLFSWDAIFASIALCGMVLIPVIEVLFRPMQGSGIDNAPILVQHLGLLFSLGGAIYAERTGHLTSLGSLWQEIKNPALQKIARAWVFLFSTFVCGVLAEAGYELMSSELDAGHTIAYGVPTWLFLSSLPIGFVILGIKFGLRWHDNFVFKIVGLSLAFIASLYATQWLLALSFVGPLFTVVLLSFLLLGGPIFLVLGGLSWALFSIENIPMAALALSHYQITVNPSLPALPLFTLAGLIFANSQAAQRLSQLFIAAFGTGQIGTVFAVACLCSCFTALTGGSGVTILALGGLMLPSYLKPTIQNRKA